MSARRVCGSAVLTLLLMTGCVRRAPPPPLTGPIGSGKALSFTLPIYPSRQSYTLASDKGSVVLLDVWATWCEPCKDSLPVYGQLVKQYGARGFKAYALNVDSDPSQIDGFIQQTGVAIPILWDPSLEVAEQKLGVRLMPTTFLLDRDGRVRYVHEGFAEEFLAQYQAEIEQLLAEPAESP